MAETLSVIAVVLYIAAGIFAALAVTFWFLFQIPSIVGELTGRTARKSIEKMRADNEKTGKKTYHSSLENVQRGKLTETMQPADSLPGTKQERGIVHSCPQVSHPVNETEVCFAEEYTLPLDSHTETEPLNTSHTETEPLSTSPMAAKPFSGSRKPAARKKSPVQLELLEEIQYLHTDETIQGGRYEK